MDKAIQTMIVNMPAKTGKSLKEWSIILKRKTYIKHSEAVNFLKSEYGITHGFANAIVQLSKKNNETPDELLANQYKGKENLKPLYDIIASNIATFGDDVEFAPKKAYVSLRRKKQFAIIQPSTKTRLDIGFNLKGKESTEKLEIAGSFNTMCSHRVRIENKTDISQEVLSWLKEAYQLAK